MTSFSMATEDVGADNPNLNSMNGDSQGTIRVLLKGSIRVLVSSLAKSAPGVPSRVPLMVQRTHDEVGLWGLGCRVFLS